MGILIKYSKYLHIKCYFYHYKYCKDVIYWRMSQHVKCNISQVRITQYPHALGIYLN